MVDKLQETGVGWWNTPIPRYAKLHRATTLPDSSIQPVSGTRVRMTALKVVGVDIPPYGSPCLPDVIVLRQICFFILEAAEPSLNHDVICPPAFSVHTLTDSIFLYEVNVLLTCELTSLIRIQDPRFRYFEGLFQALITILVSRVSSTSQPTIQRLYQSITAVRYRNPRRMGT